MKNKQNLLLKIGCSVIILIGVLFVLIPISPYNSPYSYRDSGVFLYSGWRILEGDIPYVDFWDHKPPIIFYINAIGLGLTNNSVWGVWVIELIFLFLSSVIAFRLLSQLFGFYSASVNTFLWLLALFFIIQGGNLTTEYTLLFQFGALSLFYSSQKKKFIYLILIGVLGGLAFFTKQITIGIWLAMIIYLLFTGIKNNELITAIKKAAMILAGFLIVSLIIFGYFLFRGAIGEFWEAAFIYNFAYSIRKVSGIKARILGILDFSSLMHTGIFYFSLLGIILLLIIKRKRIFEDAALSILLVSLIAFPLEILLINAPGTTYPHYFMTALPVLSIFSGLLFYMIGLFIQNAKLPRLQQVLLLLLTIALLLVGSINDYRRIYRGLQVRINEPAINYIIDRTEEEDSVLIWGAETMINFYSQRVSPSRFVYQYPLYREAYTSEDMVIEFLDDIINHQPKYILNSYGKHAPIFNFPIENEVIVQKLDQIQSIYTVVDEVNGWQVLGIDLEK